MTDINVNTEVGTILIDDEDFYVDTLYGEEIGESNIKPKYP
tara:strand:- start:174 stop:296 length:123 start_codon:yes stop_codon:yes gene_type:complete